MKQIYQEQSRDFKTALILLAGGSGTRTQNAVKKQHMRLGTTPLWQLLLRKFHKAADAANSPFFQTFIAADEPQMMSKMQPDVKFIPAGSERSKSIQNALVALISEILGEQAAADLEQIYSHDSRLKAQLLENFCSQHAQTLAAFRVLISDVARCFCSKRLIIQMLRADFADCCYAAISCSDSVRAKSPEIFLNQKADSRISPLAAANEANIMLDRSKLELIQTPQNSSLLALLRAELDGFGDESSAIAASGGSICALPGEPSNHKLTTAADIAALARKIRPSKQILATGCGFDLHEFCASEIGSPTTDANRNERLILGGIDCGQMGLKAHSDGDVLTHAIIDALLGAASLGDIGEMFSDTDARWHKASSIALLRAVLDRLVGVGLAPCHISAQILAQKPKISPFKHAIERNLSRICGCSVNVAASTTERLGVIGQGAAMAAIANASLKAYDWSALQKVDSRISLDIQTNAKEIK